MKDIYPNNPASLLRRLYKFSDDILDSIEGLFVRRHMKRGEIIESRNHIRANAFYICKGAARIYYVLKGREYTISFAFDDEYLLTSAFGIPDDVPLTIAFMEDTDIITFLHEDMYEMVREASGDRIVPEATLVLNMALIKYVAYLEERVFYLHHAGAVERYRWIINKYPRLLECATVTQIASFLGLTKETLYRIRGGKY